MRKTFVVGLEMVEKAWWFMGVSGQKDGRAKGEGWTGSGAF